VNGTGTNSTLIAQTDDIPQITLNNVGVLEAEGPSVLTLTAAQLSQFSTINSDGGSLDLVAAGAGTYDLTGKSVNTYIGLDARQTNANVTLKAGSGDAVLFSGAGVDTLIGGSGNNLFYLIYGTGAGTTFTGGSGTNTLHDDYTTDISNLNISGMQTLQTYVGALTLTAAQLSQFDTIDSYGNSIDLVAANAGTYDLTGKTLTGNAWLDARSTTDNVTMIAGSDDTMLLSGSGVDTLIGGSGNNQFYLTYGTGAGTTFTGGSGTNTLEDDYTNDISNLNISGMQTLNTYVGYLNLTEDQLNQFSTIDTNGGDLDLVAAGAGTYDLTGKTLNGQGDLDARGTSDNVTMIAGSGDANLLAGTGVDTLIGGAGNDTFYTGYETAAGSTFTGGTGTNTLVAQVNDISVMNVTGMDTLDAYGLGSVTLTADQLAEFGTINAGGPTGLVAAGAGTYDLTGKTIDGVMTLDASQTDANVTLIGNDQDGQTRVGGAGNDTLVAGTGTDVTLYGGSGTTTFQFGSAFGQDTINNDGANNTPANQINFGSGITDKKLWFQQSGNDLQIDLLGTNDSATVANWFAGDSGAQVQSINADGYTLATTQVQQLVQAMATYQTNNSGFNPTTATTMPTDTTLQNAIAANWQHA
jgi:hypothetical protein